MTPATFANRYTSLQRKFCQQAEKDKDSFLPQITPKGKVDFILIGAEPSIKRWARDDAEAKVKVSQGFRDFAFSVGDFILHYCAQNYLAQGGMSYHITNFSKGAMTTTDAKKSPTTRYASWYHLLEEELALLSNADTKIISIGGSAARFLKNRPPQVHQTILHFSNRASRYRTRCVVGREAEFEEFTSQINMAGVLQVATGIIESVPMEKPLAQATLYNLKKLPKLSRSYKMLAFGYRTAFLQM